MKKFWEIVYYDDDHKFEVIGESTDDTLLTKNVSEMQKAGMHVRCNTPDISVNKNDIKLANYNPENGLYNRLMTQYESITGKFQKVNFYAFSNQVFL